MPKLLPLPDWRCVPTLDTIDRILLRTLAVSFLFVLLTGTAAAQSVTPERVLGISTMFFERGCEQGCTKDEVIQETDRYADLTALVDDTGE